MHTFRIINPRECHKKNCIFFPVRSGSNSKFCVCSLFTNVTCKATPFDLRDFYINSGCGKVMVEQVIKKHYNISSATNTCGAIADIEKKYTISTWRPLINSEQHMKMATRRKRWTLKKKKALMCCSEWCSVIFVPRVFRDKCQTSCEILELHSHSINFDKLLKLVLIIFNNKYNTKYAVPI